jgi:hypothetical protein
MDHTDPDLEGGFYEYRDAGSNHPGSGRLFHCFFAKVDIE